MLWGHHPLSLTPAKTCSSTLTQTTPSNTFTFLSPPRSDGTMMLRSLGTYLFGGVLALLLASASGFGCLAVSSANEPSCPCDASEFTFTLGLSSCR